MLFGHVVIIVEKEMVSRLDFFRKYNFTYIAVVLIFKSMERPHTLEYYVFEGKPYKHQTNFIQMYVFLFLTKCSFILSKKIHKSRFFLVIFLHLFHAFIQLLFKKYLVKLKRIFSCIHYKIGHSKLIKIRSIFFSCFFWVFFIKL